LFNVNLELEKFKKELKELTNEVEVNAVVAKEYIKVLEESTSSERERAIAIQELIKLVPSLKEEDLEYGSNLDNVKGKIDAYVLSQVSRIEIDQLVQKNSASLLKQSEVQSILEIKNLEKRAEAARKFLKEQGERTTRTGASGVAVGLGVSVKEYELGTNELLNVFVNYSKEVSKKADPVLERINELRKNLLLGEGATPLDRKIKQFTDKSLNFLSEVLGFEQELLQTTSRSEQQIIKDEQDAKENSIKLKRDEFKEKEELRLKNYIAQQEANKKLKGADEEAIDAAIAKAKEKTSKAKTEADAEADSAIKAIKKVTEARISNQQKLDDLEKLKADMAVSESGDATSLAMMPEGMAKVEAEAALDQLRYDNKVLAAEQELALLTTTEERKREIETQMSLWRDEKRIVDLENEQNEIDEKTRIQQQYIDYISSLSSILSAIGGKNEHLRKVALIAEKGAAIASVAVEASASIGKQTAATAATSGANLANLAIQGGPTNIAAAATFAAAEKVNKASYIKNVAQTKVGAGISIAAIAAGTVAQLSGGGSSSSGGGGQTVQAPDFNIIGSTGVNQLADVIGSTTQQPIKAYVVSGEVTSAQELDRNIIDSASL